jgi:hypothetical protein
MEYFMSSDRKEDAPEHARSEYSESVSVDATTDAIAREALDEARHIGEAQRYRSNPGPVVPPQMSVLAP